MCDKIQILHNPHHGEPYVTGLQREMVEPNPGYIYAPYHVFMMNEGDEIRPETKKKTYPDFQCPWYDNGHRCEGNLEYVTEHIFFVGTIQGPDGNPRHEFWKCNQCGRVFSRYYRWEESTDPRFVTEPKSEQS